MRAAGRTRKNALPRAFLAGPSSRPEIESRIERRSRCLPFAGRQVGIEAVSFREALRLAQARLNFPQFDRLRPELIESGVTFEGGSEILIRARRPATSPTGLRAIAAITGRLNALHEQPNDICIVKERIARANLVDERMYRIV
jgi:hypothetical protein